MPAVLTDWPSSRNAARHAHSSWTLPSVARVDPALVGDDLVGEDLEGEDLEDALVGEPLVFVSLFVGAMMLIVVEL